MQFGSRVGTSAPFPMTNYPASAFFGPSSLQPKGAKAESSMSAVPPIQTVAVAVGIIVAGIVLYHINYGK